MTQYLPPNLLALFAPREPMPYKAPTERLLHEKRRVGYTGVAQYVQLFEDPKDTPPVPKLETKEERTDRRSREKAELHAYKIEQGIALWNPNEMKHGTNDAYKTLFVGRINYETPESKLRRDFEQFGPVKRISMCQNSKTGKPRGYAFVEFEKERDMHAAYKQADGRKIDGRRVLVDVERGRTVKGWLPRRLGGGLGSTRKTRLPDSADDDGVVGGGPPERGGRNSREGSQRRDREERGGGRGGDDRDRDRDRERARSSVSDRDRDRRDRGGADRGGGDRDRGGGDRDRDRRRPPPERGDYGRDSRGGRDDRRGSERDRGDRDRPERGGERPERGGDRDRERGDRKRERDRGEREERPEVKRERSDMADGSGYGNNGEHASNGGDAPPQWP